MTLKQDAKEFDVSFFTISYWLMGLGYIYKKRLLWRQMKRRVMNIKGMVVYIDEDGVDLKICKDKGWGKKGEKLVASIMKE